MRELKHLLSLLFENKKSEEQPKKMKISFRNEFTPEEREQFNLWCREFNVSAMYDGPRIY